MKLNYCFYCFLIISLIATSAKGQKSDSSRTNVIDSSNLVETKKIVSELKDKIDSLLNKKETEKTGRFKFYNPSPSVFSKQEFEKLRSEKTIDDKLFEKDLKQIRKGKTSSYTRLVATLFKPLISQNDIIEIEKIEFNIEDGQIETIRIITKENRVFENNRSIPLDGYDLWTAKIFLYDVRDRDKFIKLNDFLYFLPDAGQYYAPSDGVFVMDNERLEVPLTSNVDLNSYLDIRLYTDFLALFNKTGNGLVQTEATSKILWNTQQVFANSYILNYIEPSVRFSKFDSKFSYVQLHNFSSPVYPNLDELLKMNQFSYLELGLKLNLFKAKLFSQFSEFNIGVKYNFVDVRFKNDSTNVPANMLSYFIEAKGGFFKSKNFGMTYCLGVIWQDISKTGLNAISPNQSYIYPDISLFYYPKSDPSNKIFLRFKALTNLTFNNSFSIFQIGYSTKISFKK